MLLNQVQNQLEMIYGIGLNERAEEFLIDKKEALNLFTQGEKIPKELLLVRKPKEETVEVALFLDNNLLDNLNENDPFVSINENNLNDFCILIEGISHFVYFLWKSHNQHPITQLEMEMQAEIDKYLMLLFYSKTNDDNNLMAQVFDRLFENFTVFETLTREHTAQKLSASDLAMRYCHRIQNKWKNKSDFSELLDEVRQFYNFSQEEKIRHIAL